MRRHAKASSAGSTDGTGSARGFFRRAFATRGASGGLEGSGALSLRRRQPALIAGLALIVSLVFGASAAVAAPPTVTIDPSPTASYTTAHVSGEVVPGDEDVYLEFQYSTDEVNWSPPFNYGLFAGHEGGPQAVSKDFANLQPGTHYFVRLFALPVQGGAEVVSAGPNPSFDTLPVAAPIVSLDPITTFTDNTAHLSGSVDPNAPAGPLSDAAKAAYQANWHFECTPACHGLPAEKTIDAEDGSVNVTADVDRLEPNTSYEVKLVASNAAGPVADLQSFKTPLIDPKVESAEGASDGKGGYTLQGVVNPHNSVVTDCHFEYGPTAAYVYEAPCSPTPTGRNEVQEYNIVGEPGAGQFKLTYLGQTTGDIPYEASGAEVQTALEGLSKIGPGGVEVTASYDEHTFTGWHYTVTFVGPNASTNAGELHPKMGTTPVVAGSGPTAGYVVVLVEGGNNLPVLVEAHLTGLTPNATYHFQVFATTSAGTVGSGDGIFVPTLAPGEAGCPKEAIRAENNSLGLPECRAYEMVTPPAKNGYDAKFTDFNNSESVAYNSYAGNIANSGSGGIPSQYVAERLDTGWQTRANLNGGTNGSPWAGPNALIGGSFVPKYSADFRSSLWNAGKAGESQNASNLYLRKPDGSFVYVAPGANRELDPQNPGTNPSNGTLLPTANYVGGSDDLSDLVFNGHQSFEAPNYGPGVYEFIGTGNTQPDRRVDLDDSDNPVSLCNPDSIPGSAYGNAVSPDASVIVFTAVGGCGAGSPPADEVWARVDGDRSYDASQSHCTRTVGSPGGACNAPANAEYTGSARDGSRIFFITTQQLVNGDTDQTKDIYAYDLPTASHPSPALYEVSGASSGANVAGVVAYSEDGSSIYFISPKVLADGEDALGEPAAEGDPNLYVWQLDADHPDGETTFIARLTDPTDGCRLWSGPYAPCRWYGESTSDGRYLVFPSATPLVPTDTDNASDIYRYDTDTGTMTRASTNISGIGGNVDNFNAELAEACRTPAIPCRNPHLDVSNDGEAIVFTTTEALSPADGNGTSDVYLWKSGQVSLISSGAVGGGGEGPRIDGTGRNIYFVTAQPLSPNDTDLVGDIYDARVEGGFAAPRPTPCSGEACQLKSALPADSSLATDRANGSGNVPPGKVAVKAVGSADRAKLASGKKVGLKLKVSGPGKVSVKGTAKIGGKQKQVFAATVTAKKAGEVKLPITLSKEAQAQLRKDGSLTIQVTAQLVGAPLQTSKLVLKTAKEKSGHAKRGDG